MAEVVKWSCDVIVCEVDVEFISHSRDLGWEPIKFDSSVSESWMVCDVR